MRNHKKVKIVYGLKWSALGTLFLFSLFESHEDYIRLKDELELTGHAAWDHWKHFPRLADFLDKITSDKEES